MKKRIFTFLLTAAVCLTVMTVGASAVSFTDVSPNAWYYESVTYAVQNGIAGGRGGGIFDPGGTLTVAEAIKLACGIYADGHAEATLPDIATSPWYDAYLSYAHEYGIVGGTAVAPNATATRVQFAEFIHAAAGNMEARNTVADGDIRDVPRNAGYYGAVYELYRAGVLTGSDDFGRFFPDQSLTRAEACAIVMRALEPTTRRHIDLSGEIAPEELFELCAAAVFSIETYDSNGEVIRTGSGFFITSDGLAVTNLHVLDKSHSAAVTLTDGSKYSVSGVAAYSLDSNTALLQIDGDGFEWLPVVSSDNVKTGQTVYSLGNPLGLDGTISKGILSYVGRENEGKTFLQFTSSISQGSGGGALLDARGRVIGITSSSYTAGQTLNLATPSKFILELSPGGLTELKNVPDSGMS